MSGFYKTVLIAFLVLIASILHLRTSSAEYYLHVLHQEIFFIPIIFSSFWFGLRFGLVVAVIVCFLYTPLMIVHGGPPIENIVSQVSLQLIMYLLVAGLIGWLSDRQRLQQKQLLQREKEASLAKAASSISFEIKEIIEKIEEIYSEETDIRDTGSTDNFQQEISRLKHLAVILAQYKPTEKQEALSRDLNHLLESVCKKYRPAAKKAGVELLLDLDPAGCPTMLASESLEHTIDSLIDNALDVSKHGGKIVLRSKRGGKNCTLTVSDEGPGVAEDNLAKLFSPFFTTKDEGSGLSLSAGKKVLREKGGDLRYEPNPGGGAQFSIVVPRENIQDNIDEFAKAKGFTSQPR
ncbi:sensor histidine kinase [Desulforhopalus singaporensis]|uniref:histidine kinase n=1 Tax=Desulforhopalus singaporensis TaxID=91360 RepID=A0A1H0NAA4_9BACT|nr:HAMP domain-containing sensor histidine kinase [Desulforhopalus singaporensis]SDO89345.1 Histidine kinase-, DNA gyrase B-, and HSP90-like ATPase [Desulforhopalus singaporensis]